MGEGRRVCALRWGRLWVEALAGQQALPEALAGQQALAGGFNWPAGFARMKQQICTQAALSGPAYNMSGSQLCSAAE